MKTLREIITEKLKIDKNTKLKKKLELEPIDSQTKTDLINLIATDESAESNKHFKKMEAYMKKGSKPERLIATIKDFNKLINRWMAAVKLKWDDAIQKFGQEIEKRSSFTLINLHQYILYIYNRRKGDIMIDPSCYKNYLDLYNIKYEEN